MYLLSDFSKYFIRKHYYLELLLKLIRNETQMLIETKLLEMYYKRKMPYDLLHDYIIKPNVLGNKRLQYFFDRHGCRPIPESEIGLALLFVSLDKYCNPSITAGLYTVFHHLTVTTVPLLRLCVQAAVLTHKL